MQQANQQTANPKYFARNSFIYTVALAATATLAPAGSTTLTLTLDGDSDFFWTKFNAFAMQGSNSTVVSLQEQPAITVVIQNTITGRNYMNAATPLPNISGSGGLPFILPQETYWAAQSVISITLTNVSGNATYTQLYLSFIGIKAYFKGKNN